MIKRNQVWQHNATGTKETVISIIGNIVYLFESETSYTRAALLEHWMLVADVCDACKQPFPADDAQSVPDGRGWLTVCPDCYHDGPPESPRAAATPRSAR